MSKRTTIHLPDSVLAILGNPDSMSGRISSTILRYDRATRDACPALTESEWSLLCDMLNGTFIEDNTGDYLWADIREAGKLDGLAEKWTIDTDKFSDRVRAMSVVERYAILDVIARFWPNHEGGTMTEALTRAGAKL